MSMAMVLAILLGGLIGLEREMKGRTAGLRTHMLVCVGSTLFTLVSVHLSRGDPGRIAAQIVTGVGVLGAGAIIREGMNIRGLTTAASIWTTAAIGLALGAAPKFGELAVIATGIVVFTLRIVDVFEDWLEARIYRLASIEVEMKSPAETSGLVLARIAANRLFVRAIEYESEEETEKQRMQIRVRIPEPVDRAHLVNEISQVEGVISCHMR